MIIKYCRQCGEELIIHKDWADTEFDAQTGKPLRQQRSRKCPGFLRRANWKHDYVEDTRGTNVKGVHTAHAALPDDIEEPFVGIAALMAREESEAA